MAITQTISAIPQAGHRGIDVRDTFVTKQEAFQDALTDTFVTQINAFKTQANTLETNVNTKEATVVAKEALMNPHYAAIDSINSNMADVNTVADNIVDIQNAEENATLAINAKNAAISAKNDAVSARNEAVAAASSLPDGVINDSSITTLDTWSSNKINNELTLLNNNKQATLVSGTNIKTVNSASLLGSGDVAVQPTLVSGTNIKTINSTTLLGSGNIAVQATLVSGTNIKTINGSSVLGSGDITISAGLTSYVNAIITSQTYTIPVTGKYRITAIGAGGSGACSMSSSYPSATGGGAGGTSIHEVDLTEGQTLTVTIGAGGVKASVNSNGSSGGNTIVTNGTFTLTANGGGGGNYKINSYGGSVAGGIGGTSSGGNIANLTGGNGGNITLGYQHRGCATGGGGASLKSGAITRGGNITLNTDKSSYAYVTGGGGCFYRGGDVVLNAYNYTITTGGAGTGSNAVDFDGSPGTLRGGNAMNSISSSIVGIGGNGTTTDLSYPALVIGAATGGWSNNVAETYASSQATLPLAGSGGISFDFSWSSTSDVNNNSFLGGGSGGSASSSGTYYKTTTRGGNGVVFIEYKG